MKDFIKAILAGMVIAIAVATYLLVEEKVVGAFLFNIALISIILFDLNLFTSKISFLAEKGVKYIKFMSITTIGNIIGAAGTSLVFMVTRYGYKAAEKAQEISEMKLTDNIGSVLILSIFCGILIYLGVQGYKSAKHELGKYLIIILAIMVFVLMGAEHSIANVAYFTFGSAWSLQAVGYLVLILVGNGIGAIALHTLNTYISKEKEEKVK